MHGERSASLHKLKSLDPKLGTGRQLKRNRVRHFPPVLRSRSLAAEDPLAGATVSIPFAPDVCYYTMTCFRGGVVGECLIIRCTSVETYAKLPR